MVHLLRFRFSSLSASFRAAARAAALVALLAGALAPAARAAPQEHTAGHGARPNILWITSEDNGPHLGAYGDAYADTPHLDALAARGMIYLSAWSNAPVCAPARTTIISGLYPPSTGAEHMRSMTRLPARMKMFPQYLREAGYYCTNNRKEDYNLEKPGKVWDESSRKAHWRGRRPGQPFFAVFNFTVSHESQIRKRPHTLVHDPAKVRVPLYHPDTPEVRHDWAQYYDKVTEMDAQAGRLLAELDRDGLREDTIIFYFGDHGSGMPRSKRWPYDSGLHVPLIVSIPEKYRGLAPADYSPGGSTARLAAFIDLAPTVLSLAGIRPPEWYQGHALMGRYEAPPQRYLFGFRGRMDERYDMVRSVRDGRWIYIRNFMPEKIYGQYLDYMFKTPTTRVWRKLYDAGELRPPKTFFWEPKPPEELYDLAADPDEVRNLAGAPEHRAILERLRRARRQHALRIRDVGFLPEDEIHSRSQGSTPYEVGHDSSRYPIEKIMAMAERASSGKKSDLAALAGGLSDDDSAVRYWAARGISARGREAVRAHLDGLRAALRDGSKSVRVIAAGALARHGDPGDARTALDLLVDLADLRRHGVFIAMLALGEIDDLDERAAPARARIAALPRHDPAVPRRMRSYVDRLVARIIEELGAPRGAGAAPAGTGSTRGARR